MQFFIQRVKLIFSLITAIVIGLNIPQATFGIAMVTEPIVFENVLRGSEMTEVLHLINSEDKEVIYQLQAEGDIAGWTSFYKIDDKNLENPITEISVPANSHIKAIVKFEVPKDVPNGKYTGKVAIMTASPQNKETSKMTVGILMRIEREVSITVTDKEILDFNAAIIPNKYAIGKNQPLILKVIYTNKGNVTIKPDIHLRITQLSTGEVVHNAIYPYPDEENPVRPFERKVLPDLIKWSTSGQPNGMYKAEVRVLLDGKEYFKDDFRFRVGVDIRELLMAAISTLGGGNLLLGWFVLGAIFLLLAGIFEIIRKNPKIGLKIKRFITTFKIDRQL